MTLDGSQTSSPVASNLIIPACALEKGNIEGPISFFFSNLVIPACALDKGNIEGPISERPVVLQEDFKVRKWPQRREPAAKYVCSPQNMFVVR